MHVILLYWACFSYGLLFTYQQEVWGLAKLKCDECPKQSVIMDLVKELQKWQEDGETLIDGL